MQKFSCIHRKKVDSWKHCIEISREQIAINTFLSSLVRNGRYKERIVKKSDNLYTVITNSKHKRQNINIKDKYYTIVFTVHKDNTIMPLYLLPFPCESNEICKYIKESLTQLKL